MSTPLRTLVVDDSTDCRSIIRAALAELPEVEVIGVASDGEQALRQIANLRPDFVTLDVQMPVLGGLGVLELLEGSEDAPPVVVISASTIAGAKTTTRALQLGAFDFVLKPLESSRAANQEELRSRLAPLVRDLAASRTKTLDSGATRSPQANGSLGDLLRNTLPHKAVVIGCSTGGPAALGELLPQLPADFPKPIIIVQHMPPHFTRSLADQLDRTCQLRVSEGKHGQVCRAGEVLIAPGGSQMGLEESNGQLTLCVNDDPPIKNCKPSADYLFRDAASVLGDRCLAMVLTGMGDDGLEGAKSLRQAGAKIIAQDEATSVVYGMPRQIVKHSLADVVLPIQEMGDAMLEALSWEVAAC